MDLTSVSVCVSVAVAVGGATATTASVAPAAEMGISISISSTATAATSTGLTSTDLRRTPNEDWMYAAPLSSPAAVACFKSVASAIASFEGETTADEVFAVAVGLGVAGSEVVGAGAEAGAGTGIGAIGLTGDWDFTSTAVAVRLAVGVAGAEAGGVGVGVIPIISSNSFCASASDILVSEVVRTGAVTAAVADALPTAADAEPARLNFATSRSLSVDRTDSNLLIRSARDEN